MRWVWPFGNKKPKYPRPLSFVVEDLTNLPGYKGYEISDPGDLFVYMGEIPNMPGHGIFFAVSKSEGRISPNPLVHHIERFREATDEEV